MVWQGTWCKYLDFSKRLHRVSTGSTRTPKAKAQANDSGDSCASDSAGTGPEGQDRITWTPGADPAGYMRHVTPRVSDGRAKKCSDDSVQLPKFADAAGPFVSDHEGVV